MNHFQRRIPLLLSGLLLAASTLGLSVVAHAGQLDTIIAAKEKDLMEV